MKDGVRFLLLLTIGFLGAGCNASEDASEGAMVLDGAGIPSPTETAGFGEPLVEPEEAVEQTVSEPDEDGVLDSEDGSTEVAEQDTQTIEDPQEPLEDTAQPDESVVEEDEIVDAGVEPDMTEPAVEDADPPQELDLATLDLFGELPSAALPAPQFIAENHDGGTRTEADLVGKPTVMWFFPFAGTPG